MLDLGAVVGRVIINSSEFDRKYPILLRMFGELGARAAGSAKGMEDLDAGLVSVGSSADKAAGGLNRSKTSLTSTAAAQEKAAASAKALADAQARVAEVMAGISKESPRVQQATLRQAAAQERANVAAGQGNAAYARLAGAQASLIGSTDRLATAQGTLATRSAAVGKTMTHNITTPVLALAAGAVYASTKFDAAMTRIQTQAGGSAKDVQILSAQVLNLAKTAQQGPNELAAALYHLKSVGMDNVSAMKALTQASNLAAVGHANLEDTTNALAGAWRTGIRGAKDFHDAVSSVNAIIGAGNMTMDQFNAALGTGILPTAKTFGLTLKDVGSALALFTDEGVPADAAATRLRMSMSLLGAPSSRAEKYLNEIGLTGLRLANDMRKPNGLIVAIGDLKKHLDQSGMSLSEQSMLLSHAFGGGRSSSAILSMVNNFDVLQKKQAQVTKGMTKYDAAVRAQAATPQAKFKEAEANLGRTAVILGSKLLPAATQVLGVITKLASWFGNLSSGTQGFIIKAALVVAAVGPMLRIFGALYRTFALANSGLQLASRGLQSIGVGSRMAGAAVSALAGLAAGVTFGEMTKNASTAGKAMGALGATATGAAAGFAVGGPFGAAIGAGVGLLSDLATVLGADSAATKAYNADIGNLTQAIMANNNVTAESVRLAAAKTLQDQHVFEFAQKAGIALPLVTSAALGNAGAISKLNAEMRAARSSGLLTNEQYSYMSVILGNVANTAVGAAGKARILAIATKASAEAARHGAAAHGQLAAATRASGDISERGGVILGKVTTALHTHTAATNSDRTATMLLKQQTDALKTALSGVAARLNNAADAIAWQQALNDLTSTIKTNKAAWEGHGQAALADRAAVIGDMQTIVQHAQAMQKNGATAARVTGYIKTQYGELLNHARAAGIDKDKVDALARRMGLFPRSIHSKLTIDTTQATSALTTLLGQLGSASEAEVALNVHAIPGSRHGAAVGSRAAFKRPDGKVPPNTVATVGEGAPHTWEGLVTDSQGRATIYSNRQAKAMGFRAPVGYASGSLMGYVTGAGFRGRSAQIMDAIEMAESGGSATAHNYNPGTGDDSYGLAQINMLGSLAPERIRAYHLPSSPPYGLFDPATNNRVAWAMSNHGRDFSPWTTYTSGAYLKFMGGDGTLSNASGSLGTSPSSARAAAQAARQKARQQRQAARGAVHAGNQLDRMGASHEYIDRHGRLRGHASSVSDIRSQIGTLMSDLHDAGASKAFLRGLKDETDGIIDAARKRNHAEHMLELANRAVRAAVAKRRADFHAFRSVDAGIFDITTAGQNATTGRASPGSILATQRQAITRLRAWFTGLKKIESKVPATYFRSLEAKGPDALPELQALEHMNPGQFRTLRHQQREIAALANRSASYGSTKLDQGAVRAAEHQERIARREVRRDQHELHRAINNLGADIAHGLAHLKMGGTMTIDFKRGTGQYMITADQHHVATQRRGR